MIVIHLFDSERGIKLTSKKVNIQKTVKNCVRGGDMIEWITKSITKADEESVEIAKQLINLKLD